jgi:hypothetical protein
MNLNQHPGAFGKSIAGVQPDKPLQQNYPTLVLPTPAAQNSGANMIQLILPKSNLVNLVDAAGRKLGLID